MAVRREGAGFWLDPDVWTRTLYENGDTFRSAARVRRQKLSVARGVALREMAEAVIIYEDEDR